MNKYLSLTLLFVVASLHANCQDTLRLMNGNVLEVSIDSVSERVISFQSRSSTKTSFQERTTDEIFSFRKKGQKEVLVYKYNPDIGNFYKVDEMKRYIVGEQHADQYHNTTLTKISAVAVGTVAGYFVADGGGVVIASPILYSAIMMIPNARIQRNQYNNKLIENPAYKDGYNRVAKGKRFLNNLAYTALGMVGSFVLFEYTDAGNN
jgi:uncharacterized protein YlzI (FlbEa/FlbD family)